MNLIRIGTDIRHMNMKKLMKRLLSRAFWLLKISAVIAVIMFALLTVTLRIFNLKVGIDLQETVCMGRIFLYRNMFYPPQKFFKREIPEISEGSTLPFQFKSGFGLGKVRFLGKGDENENPKENGNGNENGYVNENAVSGFENPYAKKSAPVAVRLLDDVSVFKKGTVLLKRFFAGPGDTVIRSGGSLTALRSIPGGMSGNGNRNVNTNLPAITVMKDSPYAEKSSVPEITYLKEREYYFVGDSPLSLDSRILGPFKAEDTELAEVLFML